MKFLTLALLLGSYAQASPADSDGCCHCDDDAGMPAPATPKGILKTCQFGLVLQDGLCVAPPQKPVPKGNQKTCPFGQVLSLGYCRSPNL